MSKPMPTPIPIDAPMEFPEDLHQRVRTLQAQLDALRAEMQDFSYTVSHDLRASLRHIVSYAHLVQEDAGPQLSAEVQGFLQTITDSAKHMGQQLDALMELSRLGSVELHVQPVSLDRLIADVCDELAIEVGARDLQWQVTTALPDVMADPVLLRLALLQVLRNAVKFTTPRSRAHIEVTMHAASEPEQLVLEVRDNGVGYNPALQGKLFHVFQRLHSPKQYPGLGGLGMGLALARKSLQRFGAAIDAEGLIDEGCSVRLTLLRAASQEAKEAQET